MGAMDEQARLADALSASAACERWAMDGRAGVGPRLRCCARDGRGRTHRAHAP